MQGGAGSDGKEDLQDKGDLERSQGPARMEGTQHQGSLSGDQ